MVSEVKTELYKIKAYPERCIFIFEIWMIALYILS